AQAGCLTVFVGARLELRPGSIAVIGANGRGIAEAVARLGSGLRTGAGKAALQLIAHPQADAVAVVEELPGMAELTLDELTDHPLPGPGSIPNPANRVADVHERAGTVRLIPTVVEIAGGDAIDQQTRRRGQPVLDRVP